MKHPPDQSLTLTSVPCQDVGQVNCTQCHYGILHENCYLTVFIHELQNLGNIGHALLTFFFHHSLSGWHTVRNVQSVCCPASIQMRDSALTFLQAHPISRTILLGLGRWGEKSKSVLCLQIPFKQFLFEFLIFSEIN